MTGRAAGYCAGYPVPGFMNAYGGRGMGIAWRRGWGRGRGAGGYTPAPYVPPAYRPPPFWSAPSREDEMEMLRGQADWLKGEMEAVNQRIQELEKEED